MATYILTINGVERPLRLGSLNLRSVVNGRDVLSCDIASVSAAYRPTLGHPGVLTEDGTAIFGGFIDAVEETKISDDSLPDDIVSRITLRAYNTYADRRYVTETVAAGTSLKTLLTTLVDDYLDDYGVTLDGSQVDGPNLEAWAIDGVLLSSVLDSLTTMTGGYVWEIDANKVFRMFLPGSVSAPFNVVDGDGNHVGDIRVRRTRQKYANRIIVKYGKDGVTQDYTDNFTGDGSEDAFELSFQIAGPLVYNAGGAVGYAVVHTTQSGSTTESLGGPSAGLNWTYDHSTREITRVLGPVTNGLSFSVTYQVQYPQTVIVQDDDDIAANGIWEQVVNYPDIYDKAVAEALAEELLAIGVAQQVEVEYDTHAVGIQPGQTQTITAADRNINGTFLVSEVSARTEPNAQLIRRTVRAISSEVFTGSFRDVYKAWLGGGTGGSTSISIPASSASGGVPFPPERAIQFNRSGAFGGDADFTWDEVRKNLISGDGCTVSSGAEGCDAGGVDCHIGGSW